MPCINIKLLGGQDAPSVEQKEALIKGVTDLMVSVLGKNPAAVVVTIDELSVHNYGIGGESVAQRRSKAQKA